MRFDGRRVYGRRLTVAEATALGYVKLMIREDDGTVQSMQTKGGFPVRHGQVSYLEAVRKADASKTM